LPQAGGLRYCTAATFASLKKYAAHFFNFACGATEAKEAAHAVAGVNSEKYLLKLMVSEASFYMRTSYPFFYSNSGLRKIALRNLRIR
jgi:hypothetical protein